MPHTLVVSASNWNAKLRVSCTFVVKANNAVLSPMPGKPQFFQLPDNTVVVEITATPIAPAKHWPNTVFLAIDPSGGLVAAKDSLPFAQVKSVPVPPDKRSTAATCRLSRFRDVSAEFNNLLKTPPTKRFRPDGWHADDEQATLVAQYGSWPPASWAVSALDSAAYLDVTAPVDGTALKFLPRQAIDPKVATVILELQGATTPRIFGVTWPEDASRLPGKPSPSFLLYLRQTSGQNILPDGMFEGTSVGGSYPRKFDYAERCLFESMHYGLTPLQSVVQNPDPNKGPGVLGVALRPKGAPYQIAKSGVPVVAVYPVMQAYSVPEAAKEVSELVPMDNMERILEEIQAFMFWEAKTVDPPHAIGKTAISAFSSTNYILEGWLRRQAANGYSKFFSDKVTALYLFDPPDPPHLIGPALNWAKVPGSKKRIRFYGRGMDDAHPDVSPIHESLLAPARLAALRNGAQHPPVPFIETNPAGHTVALLPFMSWQQTFANLGMADKIFTWDAHHLIPATMLTHALAQGDL